jgi:catechol 2,3-dioxygenase-like lactoylglutathione lyase family enzyme
MQIFLGTALASALLGAAVTAALGPRPTMDDSKLELGNFSVSLAVKDLAASRAFYEKLGFEKVGGVQEQNWLVLQNGTTKIGLFQGMFEKNCLTFNPGWDSDAQPLESFTDVREIQARLEAAGLELVLRADPESTGVAHCTLLDPDGNPILIDQHVPRPKD